MKKLTTPTQGLVSKVYLLKPTLALTLTLTFIVCLMISASAQCTGDCQNGKGKKVDADGNTFEGQWKNGKLEGTGTMAMPDGVKYVGEFKAGNMHGYGVVYLANGTVAQSGIYDTNKLSTALGESAVLEILKKKQTESAPTASGGCTGDCQNGKGKKVDADGNTFEGQWKNGKLNGIGTMAMPDGVKYVGEFKDDSMHGYGIVYLANGSVAQSGIYENNKLSSSLTESAVLEVHKKKQSDSGFTASNGCTGDCQNGKGKFVDADGNSFEGQWKNGKLEGYGIMAMPNGVKYVGEFKEQNMHGYGVVYLANGSVAQSGVYENNALKTSKSETEVKMFLAKYN